MSSEQAVQGAAGGGAVLDGRYRLSRRLGRGGMADVWAAEDLLLHRPVAVKLFRFDADGTDEARIQVEMRIVAGLNHPGVVTVYDAGTAHDPAGPDGLSSPYLVMELVDGPTLAARLAEGLPPGPEVAALIGQLAGTLAFVHDRGVVHRDIKPANVLLQSATNPSDPLTAQAQPTRARLTDFGVARPVDSTRLTGAGLTLGTANYLSPEQATGLEVGPPSDVYSLGLVGLECLTGQVAYPGVGVEAALARLHRRAEIPMHLDEWWRDLLAAMTAPDPAARPTAAEVARSVADGTSTAPGRARASADPTTVVLPGLTAGGDGSTRLMPAATAPRIAARPRFRRWLLLAALAATAVIVVALVAALSGRAANAPQAPSTTVPSYPSVPGRLGTDLRRLQGAVG